MPASSAANSDTFKVSTPPIAIVLTRLFDAPRRLVFDAMTRPSTSASGGDASTTATRSRSVQSTCATAVRRAS